MLSAEALAIYQAGPQTVVPVFLENARSTRWSNASRGFAGESRLQDLARTRATAASRPPAMGSTNLRPRAFARKASANRAAART